MARRRVVDSKYPTQQSSLLNLLLTVDSHDDVLLACSVSPTQQSIARENAHIRFLVDAFSEHSEEFFVSTFILYPLSHPPTEGDIQKCQSSKCQASLFGVNGNDIPKYQSSKYKLPTNKSSASLV